MRMTASLIMAAALLAANPAYQEATAAALLDAQKVSPASRSQLLYLYVTSEDDLPAVSYAISAVSRTRVIRQPSVVGPNLLRVQLAWLYGTDAKAAKEILKAREALSEGYFTNLDVSGQIRLGLSPAYAQLQQVCYSALPLLRADQFVSQILGEAKHYYAWSGVPAKQGDFYKSLGLDVKTVENVRAELEANLFVSKITGKPRRIVHYLAPFGSVFVTQDIAAEREDNSPVVGAYPPKGQAFKFDASEIFALKANGTWITALYDAKGARQNAVPANIATDQFGQIGRAEVTAGASCFRCHERLGNAGLQPFRDAQVVIPTVGDPFEVQRLSDVHDADRLSDAATFSGQTYIKSVARITAGYVTEGQHVRSMIPTEATDAFVGVWESYTAPVTLATAARELGLDEAQCRVRLQASTATGAYGLLSGESITRQAWEEVWRSGHAMPTPMDASSPQPTVPRIMYAEPMANTPPTSA